MNEDLTTLQVLMLENEVQDIGNAVMGLYKSYKSTITEAIDDFLDQDNDLAFMFEEAKKRFLAAKRGLALTNKLQDPLQRKEHKSRVLSNLNKLRAIFKRLEQAVNDVVAQAQNNSQNKDLFQQATPPGIKNDFNQPHHPPAYRQFRGPQTKEPQQAQQ